MFPQKNASQLHPAHEYPYNCPLNPSGIIPTDVTPNGYHANLFAMNRLIQHAESQWHVSKCISFTADNGYTWTSRTLTFDDNSTLVFNREVHSIYILHRAFYGVYLIAEYREYTSSL